MKNKLIAASTLLLLTQVACRTTSGNSGLKDADNNVDPNSIKVLKCESGETASFVLKNAETLPKVSDFPALEGAPDEVGDTTGSLWTRLDACMDGDVLEIKRVVSGYDEAPTVVGVTTGAVVEGLNEAVFDQNYEKLKINIPFVKINKWGELKDSNELFYMRGSKDGKSVVAGIAAEVDGKLEYATSANSGRFLNTYQAGVLEYEEPTDKAGCSKVADASGTFTLGTATFSWLGKARTGTSGGAAPHLCQITVVDTAKQLGTNAGKPVTVEFPFDASTDDYKFTSNHHSVCDSFLLKTSFASYGATANSSGFGGGSCPASVKGAPKADATGTNYIFTYGTEKVEGTQKNCTHPTRRCATADTGLKIMVK